ncbi:MAG: hypothetical protein AAGA47_12420 [Pseudomonadota bacterium]
MLAAAAEVVSIYALVFWHALTVSFIAWVLLPLGLLMRADKERSFAVLGRVFGVTMAFGLAIMAVGSFHGGTVAQTPDYVHGLACVFGVASAMTVTWAMGRVLRLWLIDSGVGARLRARMVG